MILNAGAQRDINNIHHHILKLCEGDPVTVEDNRGDQFIAPGATYPLDAAMALHAAQKTCTEAQAAPTKAVRAATMPALTTAGLDEVQKKVALLNVAPFIRDRAALLTQCQGQNRYMDSVSRGC
jgi:hypothetical protein